MSSSDWLAIVLALVSIMISLVVAWTLYRAQSIESQLSRIDHLVNEILKGRLTRNDLLEIREVVTKIDGDLNKSISLILSDVKEQQNLLAEKIQKQFEIQSVEARDIVKD